MCKWALRAALRVAVGGGGGGGGGESRTDPRVLGVHTLTKGGDANDAGLGGEEVNSEEGMER